MILILSVSDFLYSRTVPKFIMENYVALNYGKTTQIIHGNVRLHTGGRLTNNTTFFGIGPSKRLIHR
jgi:hypothetical protein